MEIKCGKCLCAPVFLSHYASMLQVIQDMYSWNLVCMISHLRLNHELIKYTMNQWLIVTLSIRLKRFQHAKLMSLGLKWLPPGETYRWHVFTNEVAHRCQLPFMPSIILHQTVLLQWCYKFGDRAYSFLRKVNIFSFF